MTRRTGRALVRLFDVNPSAFLLLSTVFLAEFVNLFTVLFASEPRPKRVAELGAATVLAAISATLWAIVAWRLDQIDRIAQSDDAGLLGHRRVRQGAIESDLSGLTIRAALGAASALACLVTLVV
jgi:hypothetical protein